MKKRSFLFLTAISLIIIMFQANALTTAVYEGDPSDNKVTGGGYVFSLSAEDGDELMICKEKPYRLPSVCSGRFSSTRVFPETCKEGDEFAVTVNVNIDESNKPRSLVLEEHIPEGFEVMDTGGGSFNEETRTIRWFMFESRYHGTRMEDRTFTYRLMPEGHDAGLFSGTLEDSKEIYTTQGDDELYCPEIPYD